MQAGKLLLLYFLTLRAVVGRRGLLPPATSENSIFYQAIIEIVHRSFLNDISIINAITAPHDERVKLLMDSIANEISRNISSVASIRVCEIGELVRTQERRLYNILLVSECTTTFGQFDKAINGELFELQGFFLVVFVGDDMNPYRDMNKIFQYMWSKFIINVNIVVATSPNELEMFTYFPYTPAHCSRTAPVLINKFADSSFRRAENYYPEKTGNLFGCPLRVATFNIAPLMFATRGAAEGEYELSGIDGELVKGEKRAAVVD